MKKQQFLQHLKLLGVSFLLPVSVLPGAGILLGIGNAFTNATTLSMYSFLQNEILQFIMQLFIALGNVAFSNLPVIFAVGVAVGLAKIEKGSAALSGLLGFLTLHIMLNFFLTQTNTLALTTGMNALDAKKLMVESMQTSVLGIQTMDLGVFGGIITGLIVYWVHQKVVKVQLPEVLGFFSGPRLVPLVTLVVMTVVAGLLFLIWPTIRMGIMMLSDIIIRSSYVGTFFYGILERLLLPFGLHHGLNWPVYMTDIGGVWDICGEPVGGTVNAYIAALSCPSITTIDPNLARFNSGKFLYFMFGLPGAAYAMYKTASEDNRKQVGSLLLAAAGTSFITGITEPIEFTFLFAAPMLYAVHALLAGISTLTMHLLGAAVATPIGHGLINFFIYGVIQGFKTKWYIIALAGPICFAIYYYTFHYLIVKFNLKTPGRDGNREIKLIGKEEMKLKYGFSESINTPNTVDVSSKEQAVGLIAAHGGFMNIESIDACITRLRVNVKDETLVDKSFIKDTLHAQGVIETNKQIQSIYGARAHVLKMEMQQLLNERK